MNEAARARARANTVLVCCSVFRAEVESLRQEYWPEVEMAYQDSMFHMRPQLLAQHLQEVIDPLLAQGRRVVLIYGDCCMAMAALEAKPGVVRTRGHNCCELLLGKEQYHRLSHLGAFFLFPEWTGRWREIFTEHLGLSSENASDLMGEMHHGLIYLDTGVLPVPVDALQACAQYCGLPWEVQKVSLEPLRQAINEALVQLQTPREGGMNRT